MNKPRILLIDDDQRLTQAMQINLEATGDFEVKAENHSARALLTAREFNPDLIILDYVMPGADGGDVSRHLHADEALRHVPIIMLTALISNEETGTGGCSHRNGHLMVAKPVRMKVLLRCIREQLLVAH